jgi:rod shape-determining protein MreD
MAGNNIIRFFLLILLQALLFSNINFHGYVYPAFYIYFILLLPFETAGWLLLMSSFMLGLGVDYFSNSLGINAAAATFTAFIRPGLFRLLKSKKEYEPGLSPGIRDLGFRWFLMYALLMITAHHSVLFFLEVFSFENYMQTIYRIIASSLVTLVLVILTQFIFYHRDKK